ncbi:hypothetical protein MTO96_039173 [Rhipicephalus appendiculatus]
MHADRGSRQSPSLQPGDTVYARNFRQGAPSVRASVVDVTPPSAHISLDDGSIWRRHGDHLRIAQTGPPMSSDTNVEHRAGSAAIPEQGQPAASASTVLDMPEHEAHGPPGSSPESAIEGEITASDSGAPLGSNCSVTVPGTLMLRRSERSRKPVFRYSP